MKVVIAIDSFKGSMSSIEAGEAAAAGIRKVYSEAKTKVYPLADGGEGTVRALAQGLGGSLENVTVTGPLGAPVVCEYAIWEKRNIGGSGRIDFVGKEMMAVSENASVVENTSIIESKRGYKNEKKCGKTAIIEMAGAAGITLVPPELLNPINTTTYGVGEVIKTPFPKAAEILSSESEAVQRMMVESVCFRLWEESFWIKVENRCHLEQKVWKSLPPSVAKICFRN